MTELLHFDLNENYQKLFLEEIKTEFPNIIIKDAYCHHKGFRSEIIIDDLLRDHFYAYIISHGYISISFHINRLCLSDKPEIDRLYSIARELYPKIFLANEKA